MALVAAVLLSPEAPRRAFTLPVLAVAATGFVTAAALVQAIKATRCGFRTSPATRFLVLCWLLPAAAGGMLSAAGITLGQTLLLFFPPTAIWALVALPVGIPHVAAATIWSAGCALAWFLIADRQVRALRAAPSPPDPPPGVTPMYAGVPAGAV